MTETERIWLLERLWERSGTITSYTAKQNSCGVCAVALSDWPQAASTLCVQLKYARKNASK